jgi:hypothetical protein
MDIKKIAAGAATAGLLSLGGLGAGLGLANADPPTPTPNPGNSDNSGGPVRPAPVTGPGDNAGQPGTPLPPGLNYLPAPGHGGPMPQDRIEFPTIPSWITTPVTPPMAAPPQPELPDWATGLPVVWNPDLGTWGVWLGDQQVFVRL